MRAKTIKKILREKHNDWLCSIEDESLRKKIRQHTIITGGSIASMFIDEKVNDYDVYFTDKNTLIDVCKYYIKKFEGRNIGHSTSREATAANIALEVTEDRVKLKINTRDLRPTKSKDFEFPPEEEEDDVPVNQPIEDEYEDRETHKSDESSDEKPKYRPVFLSANAITLANQIQIVIRFYGTPEQIHENYDFVHCTMYWEAKTGDLHRSAEALEALMTRELVYNGSKYPLASIIRTRKFIKRGFKINAGQYLKMALQLNDLNLRDISTLEDQLIGMDALYFRQILAAIPSDRIVNGEIDSHYVIEIINRVF